MDRRKNHKPTCKYAKEKLVCKIPVAVSPVPKTNLPVIKVRRHQKGSRNCSGVSTSTQCSTSCLPPAVLPNPDPEDLSTSDSMNFFNSHSLYNPVFSTILKKAESEANSIFDSHTTLCGVEESEYKLNEFGQSSDEVLRTFDFWSASRLHKHKGLVPTKSDALRARTDKITTLQMNPTIAAKAFLQSSKANLLVEFLDGIEHIEFVPLECTEGMLTGLFEQLLPVKTAPVLKNASSKERNPYTAEAIYNHHLHSGPGPPYTENLDHNHNANSTEVHKGWLTTEYMQKFKKEVEDRSWKAPNHYIVEEFKNALASVLNFFTCDEDADTADQQPRAQNRSIKEAPARIQRNMEFELPKEFGEHGSVRPESASTFIATNLFTLAGVQALPPNLALPFKPRKSKKKFDWTKPMANTKQGSKSAGKVDASQQTSFARLPKPRKPKVKTEVQEKEVEFLLRPPNMATMLLKEKQTGKSKN